MNDDALLELQIDSQTEAVVRDIESNLAAVNVTRWKTARMDPVTILALAAGTVKLVSALLELKEKLAKQPDAPAVTVKGVDGTRIALSDATADVLESLLAAEQPDP